MTCVEWLRAVERYRTAAVAYSQAVSELGGVPEFESNPEFEFKQAWQRAEQARQKTDAARAALLSHQRVHACLLYGSQATEMEEELVFGDQGQSGG
jgi:hypothetical protein